MGNPGALAYANDLRYQRKLAIGLRHERKVGLKVLKPELAARANKSRLPTGRMARGGRTIDQPWLFIAGASDWGPYQNAGALERMQNEACTDMRAVYLVDGAGHWVELEQPEETSRLLIEFLRDVA